MKKNKRNPEIRELIEKSGFCYWEVAELLNIKPAQFSYLLRYPLKPEFENEIRKIVTVKTDL